MAKLNKQQLYKRAYEWQKLKDKIEAKEKAMELQVKETDKLRAINKKLRAKLAEAKSLHESSGLNKPFVSASLLSIENTDKYAKKWADNFGEIGDTNYSIALTSYRRGLKRAVKIISNAR